MLAAVLSASSISAHTADRSCSENNVKGIAYGIDRFNLDIVLWYLSVDYGEAQHFGRRDQEGRPGRAESQPHQLVHTRLFLLNFGVGRHVGP
jgi:hypothetical protein